MGQYDIPSYSITSQEDGELARGLDVRGCRRRRDGLRCAMMIQLATQGVQSD